MEAVHTRTDGKQWVMWTVTLKDRAVTFLFNWRGSYLTLHEVVKSPVIDKDIAQGRGEKTCEYLGGRPCNYIRLSVEDAEEITNNWVGSWAKDPERGGGDFLIFEALERQLTKVAAE